MEKYKIQINIEFNAKDFLQAEKLKGRIEECVLPVFLTEWNIRSWEIILQKKGRGQL